VAVPSRRCEVDEVALEFGDEERGKRDSANARFGLGSAHNEWAVVEVDLLLLRAKCFPLGKIVTSPFSILVKVVDGRVTYPQFLEDSYATASSFRESGARTIKTEPDSEPFDV
jgi:hypothetical protein